MIKKTAKNSHIKKILFILTTLLLVIGFTAFLVKDKGFKTLAYSSDLFVTRWQTNVPGATDPTKVTLRFLKVATDTYEVSWNCDDNYELFYTSLATHNYPTAGTYDVCVRSTRPLRFYAPDLADDEKAKLLEIKQWGTIPWSSFMSAFKDMKNMQLTATDTPDLSNVTDMSYAFNGATAFTGHSSMNNWNTSNIKNMSYMFYGATSFNQYIGNWNTGNVTSMLYMFNAATNFNNGEASGASNNTMNWNTQNVLNMAYMFYGAKAFNQKIGSWDTNNVTSIIGMFFNASTFNQYIGNWQTGKVTSMTYMFSGAVAFNNGDAPGASSKPLNWDTSKVTFMNNMFSSATSFNQYIGNWNTGNVTSMTLMFYNAKTFNQDIGSWDTSKVKNMSNVFYNATAFNQYIGNWQTGEVTNMASMFNGATNFNNGDVPGGSSKPLNWNTVNVTDMSFMFVAKNFNQPIGHWNTKNVNNMAHMFRGASQFNQYIGNWNTGNVNNMEKMFESAPAFNNGAQPGDSSKLLNWNTAKVTNMSSMFNGATTFNQNISNFNIPVLTQATNMLNNSGMSTPKYDALLNSWSQQTVKPNVALGAVGIYYCTAKPARDILTGAPNNWTITDGGQNCPPQNLTLSNTEVNENSTEVGTITATDDNLPIIYTLVVGQGDEDNSKFALNTTTGYLTFLEAPDYENPTDLGDTPNNNTYSIRVRATDNTAQYSETIFIITVKDIDDVPPIITITAPTKMAKGPITDTTFTVSDRFSIASVEVDTSSVASADSIVCTPPFPYVNPAPSPENHITLNCTIRILSSGKLVLKATDNNGNSTTATEEGYVIDTLGPTFSVANVDTTINGLHNPVVSFEAHDPVGVQKYEIIFIQDNNGPGISPNQTIETVQYTGGVQQLTISLDPHEASHVVEIKAYDNTGNTTSRRITFPPVVTINAPTIISNQPIDDTTVTITSPVNGNLIDHIVISGSASAGVTLGTCTDKNNNTTAPYNTTVTCEIHGIQATGMVAIQAQDITSGAIGSNLQKYFYDTSAPNIIITAPTKIKNDNITDVTIAVTDNIDLFSNSVTIDTSTTAGYNNLVCNTDENDKSIVNCTLTITSSGNLVIKATDKAGNFSTAIESNFIIDRTAPVVTIDTPVAVNYNNQVNYTLSGTCTAGDNDLIVTIGIQPYVAICGVDETWSLLVDLSSYTDGEIVVSVKQTDTVGNQTTEGATLQKDTIPLVVIINQTAIQHDPTNTQPIRFTIIFSESIKEDTFTKEDINVTGSTTYQKGNITKISDIEYEFEITNLTDGDTVTVDIPAGVCTDLAGNNNLVSTSIDNSVTYDVTSPTVTVNQAIDQADPTNINSAKYTIIFSEPIKEDTFTKDDLVISGSNTATVSQLSKVNDTTYTATVVNMVSGETISLTLPADKVQDLAGNKNSISTSNDNSVTYDNTAPTVTINQSSTQADPTNINSVKYTVIFSEPIKEDSFTNEDILISGSSTAKVKSITKINDTEYEVEIEQLTDGDTVIATIPADVLTDLAGNKNIASTSTDSSVTYAVEGEEEEDDETPPTQEPETPTTPLDSKPAVKPKNPFDKYINPVIEQEETTTPTKEDSSDRTSKTTPPTQSKSLRIKVYNESREPIKGVTVEIHSDVRTGITDEHGEVYFENLETGLHTMIISYNGYRAEKEIKLINNGEEEMEINIKLEKVIIPNYVYWLIALIVLLTILLGYNIYKRKQVEKK